MDLFEKQSEMPSDVFDAPDHQALSVAEAIEQINDQLYELAGGDFTVEGEVSEFGISQGKWVRFVLKDLDDGALLKCFMTTYQLDKKIEDGDHVVVKCTPKVYPRYGQFTLNVRQIDLVGEGALAAALEKLKRQFEAEGLFDPTRKRALPAYPDRIGLITSREAAAFTDFQRILANRWGGIEIQHAHVNVQGQKAVGSICRALDYFNNLDKDTRPDVLVLTRGGGSVEDMMAFNAEQVVRAVFASQIPIVVGVGHERDESLAEFAADVRASTPSNAAERVVPDRSAVERGINATIDRLASRLRDGIRRDQLAVTRASMTLTQAVDKLRFHVDRQVERVGRFGTVLRRAIEENKMNNEAMVASMGTRLNVAINQMEHRVSEVERYIKEFDPMRVLRRGYAMVRSAETIVTDPTTLDSGDHLQVQFAHGSVDVEVSAKSL